MLDFIRQAPQWLQAIILVLGFLSTVATALGALLAAIAPMFPAATSLGKAHDAVVTFGVDLKKILSVLSSLTGRGAGAAAFVLVGALSLGAAGCQDGKLSPKVVDGGEIALCIASGAANGLSPLQIALKCGVEDAKLIEDILSKHKAGVVKQLAAAGKDCAK